MERARSLSLSFSLKRSCRGGIQLLNMTKLTNYSFLNLIICDLGGGDQRESMIRVIIHLTLGKRPARLTYFNGKSQF